MNKSLKKSLKVIGFFILGISGLFLLLLFTGVIWRSPGYYEVGAHREFAQPVMTMQEYSQSREHVRPYNYRLGDDRKGEVYVLGIDHTKDPADRQIHSVQKAWEEFDPDVLLVEGRLGFFFSGLQDPVKRYGEGGKAMSLAKRDKVEFYTWEPKKQDEINMMLKRFPAKRVAMFYSLRPYLSNFRFGKPEDPDAVLQSFIKSRTDYDGIRGEIVSVFQIDSIWKTDFAHEKDWRDSSDEYGWPQGYLSDMAAYSNEIRNIHMVNAILELVEKDKKVFITMGSSHAFRIENTLREEISRK
ncbi:hypothetical protein V6B16_12960 [Salinimicrobium catena]|uniref:hypothetical protein n=1 Tax=Salinimicrobium catena TaxID=390640 RepID=UPI002FE47F3B